MDYRCAVLSFYDQDMTCTVVSAPNFVSISDLERVLLYQEFGNMVVNDLPDQLAGHKEASVLKVQSGVCSQVIVPPLTREVRRWHNHYAFLHSTAFVQWIFNYMLSDISSPNIIQSSLVLLISIYTQHPACLPRLLTT